GIATDISEDALAIARRNADRHGIDGRIEFLHGDLLAPLIDHPGGGAVGGDLHYLVSNPPYIPDSEWDAPDMVGVNVRDFEPHGALRGGEDGLKFLRPLIEQGPDRLRPRGVLMLETAAATARAAAKLLRDHPLIDPESVRTV